MKYRPQMKNAAQCNLDGILVVRRVAAARSVTAYFQPRITIWSATYFAINSFA